MRYFDFITQIFELFGKYFRQEGDNTKTAIKIQEVINNVQSQGLTDIAEDELYDNIMVLFENFCNLHNTHNDIEKQKIYKESHDLLESIRKKLDIRMNDYK